MSNMNLNVIEDAIFNLGDFFIAETHRSRVVEIEFAQSDMNRAADWVKNTKEWRAANRALHSAHRAATERDLDRAVQKVDEAVAPLVRLTAIIRNQGPK